MKNRKNGSKGKGYGGECLGHDRDRNQEEKRQRVTLKKGTCTLQSEKEHFKSPSGTVQ